MGSYRQHALEGASGVELVLALYDGIIRFLYAACEAVDRGDEDGRRAAVKRAMDIVMHLQSRLRRDVGGRPAEALSEFYASIFAQMLQASQAASRQKFLHVIGCVRNVREAWQQAASEGSGPGVIGAILDRDREASPGLPSHSSNWNA